MRIFREISLKMRVIKSGIIIISGIALLSLPHAALSDDADLSPDTIEKNAKQRNARQASEVMSDLQLGEFGGDSECNSHCDQVIGDANKFCADAENEKDEELKKASRIACDKARTSQVYLQCAAYTQAGWSAYFDSQMLVLDGAAAVACSAACGAILLGAVGGPAFTACTAAGVADGMGDVAYSMALHIINGEGWAGETTGDRVGTALGIAGCLM